MQTGESEYRAKYTIENKTLTLGHTVNIVKKLDSDSLIFTEEEKGLFPVSTTYYYFKSDKNFEAIREYEKFKEMHSNGQLKEKRTYHNGLEDGLWEEWYENGKKRSERHFKEGISIDIWKEWDENGKLIKNEEKNK